VTAAGFSTVEVFGASGSDRLQEKTEMALTDRPLRVIVAAALPLGMVALWAGSIYHYGDASTAAPAVVADAQAHPAAQLVNAVSVFAETILFTIAILGLVALVRERGRTFLLAACGVLAVGLPSHVVGGTYALMLHQLATSSLPTATQVDVLEAVEGLGGVYFALIIPFLLGLVLLTAALWRARVVSWQPFALLLGDIVFGTFFTSGTSPSYWLWWVDPIVTVASFAWIGVALVRGRGNVPEEQPALEHAMA
jgi:hypothetical protein